MQNNPGKISEIALVGLESTEHEFFSNLLEPGRVQLFSGYETFKTGTDTSSLDIVITGLLHSVSILHDTSEPGQNSEFKVIVVTDIDDLNSAIKVMREGAFDFITRPLQGDLVLEVIQRCMKVQQLENENLKIMHRLRKRESEINTQLRSAKVIQDYLLATRFPAADRCEFASIFEPVDIISGDYYEFIRFREKHLLGVFVCDITGHGIPAALLVSIVKFVASETLRININPLEAMKHLNSRLNSVFPLGNFASSFYGIINFEEMSFTYVKACADPALLFRCGEAVYTELDGETQLLALSHLADEEPAFESHTVSFDRGDILYIYTDGLTEVQGEKEAHFEVEGIKNSLARYEDKPLQEQLQLLKDDILAFSKTGSFLDDVTIIGLKFK